jgi:transcriptional regulator with XRE-family HTH domain
MDNLGMRLQALRGRRGLSQRKLAARAGVSNATVSLIESGRTDPSMGLMKRILESLGVSFAEFFADESHISEQYFYTRDELSEISSGPISYRQVGSDLSKVQLQILYEQYLAGADTGQSRISHEAEEGGIVIRGRLEVSVGDRMQTLSAGDAYRFNSRIPHRFRNPGKEVCIVVSACTPPSF